MAAACVLLAMMPAAAAADMPAGGQVLAADNSAVQQGVTAEQLLEGSVLLKPNSHAAVANNGVTAIFPGERMITACQKDGQIFVPLRFAAERLGAEVDWENESKTVVIQADGRTIRLPIGGAQYSLDGESRPVDAAAWLQETSDGNGRTMVSTAFLHDALGYQVEWDETRGLLVIAGSSATWDLTTDTAQAALDRAVGMLIMYGMFV